MGATPHYSTQALGERSSVVAAHRLSSCGSQALEYGLSRCGAWLNYLQHMESSRTRNHTHIPPCTGRQILTHCTTKEVPEEYLLKYCLKIKYCLNIEFYIIY